MSKRGDLSAALKEVSGRPDPLSPVPVAEAAPTGARAAARIGKRQISGFFDPAVGKQLKKLAADRDTSNQELLREALNDLFAKYGLSPIA